ncbi:HupE/UreJ family protein [Microvirga tunisiensis]|uniref:HupE/UreJ family protein n=1 Tax=Microvirga tunisiensis TaxID=2108360 RepID=A0A5N7MZL4_9HYPH|nr:HupE/UreJ family protein [Microvirga tunisiensis]MPR11282.1 HupE/UreJ family protein [Microvirga tunisiensis]MPR29356.1 HupE/UreJ family protein [Microvirga tunisiensis]
MRGLPILVALASLLTPLPGHAHEVRPAYLDLREERTGEFSVLWKTPMVGEMRLALQPVFSGRVQALTPVAARMTGDAAVQTWHLRAKSLRGQTLRIEGLEATLTDALVRVTFLDGSTWVQRLTPRQPAYLIPAQPHAWGVAGTYLTLGIEHILTGIDHLLFVLALLLLTKGTWRLVKTVTAFTVAHSITLGLATLGTVHVPSKPVEAVIALSIVFVAAEIVHARSGRVGLAARMPWIVAFTFGLLHGFGFAGALSEVGLPEGQIPVALLFFNLGVEVGQLLFVAAVLALVAGTRRIPMVWPRWAGLVPPYAIGSLAMFWVIQRVAAF